MDAERTDRHPPRFGRRRNLLWLLVPILLIVAGVGLTIASSLPQSVLVGAENFEGMAAPGDTARPLTRMDYTAVAFEADDLPCPLFVYPLSQVQHRTYLASGDLPPASLNCDRPSLDLTHLVTNFLLRNLDPSEDQNYSLNATYFTVSRPNLGLGIPAIILVFLGGITLLVRMLTRGIERFMRDADRK